MIKEVKAYTIVCDRCGTDICEDYAVRYTHKHDTALLVERKKWATVIPGIFMNQKDYCPDCIEFMTAGAAEGSLKQGQ